MGPLRSAFRRPADARPLPPIPDRTTSGGWRWCFFRLDANSREANVFGTGAVPFRRSAKLARLEAALLVADNALSTRRLAQCAKLADVKEVRELVDQLNVAYDQGRTAFRIERVATGYQMLTRPKFAAWLDKLHHRQARLKLSPAMMETLSIVAYRQPITRADVEAVRGVQASEMLKQLMERGLVKVVGEDDSLGRPYLYGTTRQFLESYGLRRLDDLPLAETLRVKPATAEQPPDADEETEAAPDELPSADEAA